MVWLCHQPWRGMCPPLSGVWPDARPHSGPALAGADRPRVLVLVVLCCFGGRGASSSVWTDVPETVRSFVSGWFVALGYLATRWRSGFLKAAVCGPRPGACAEWGQWGAEAWSGAPPALCTVGLTSGPAEVTAPLPGSCSRVLSSFMFSISLCFQAGVFQNVSPESKLKNVRCSLGKSWDIRSELGFLVAGLLRAFKMVITRWAVSPLPRLPLQLGREGDYWCVSSK